jgi:hypothetical protein
MLAEHGSKYHAVISSISGSKSMFVAIATVLKS